MTFREKSITRLYAFAMAAVFALVLAGCGGGGGTAATPTEPPGTVDPGPTPAEMAASAAATAAAAAKTIAEGISDDEAVADQKAAAMAAYMEASAAATAAQTAADDDDEVEARVQQRLAENARDDAQMYANAATKALADAAAAAAKAANNKMVMSKVTAISSEADTTTGQTRPFDGTNPYDPDATDNSANNYGIAIKYDDGAMVTITDGALTAKNDPKFEMMDGKYMRDNGGGVSEIISVMTDIEAPKSMAFSKVYDLTLNDDPDRTGDQFSTYAVLATDNGKIASSEFPSTPNTDRSFDPDDDTTDDENEGEIRGTFDGAPGTFECVVTSGTCDISTDDEGKIEALTAGDWEFTPVDGAMVSVADSDYLHYGFWIKKTVADGETTYNEVQTFAGSSLDATSATDLGNVVDGSAKYEGGAHGVYTHYTVNADTSVDSRSAGTFTADVALMAYFGTQTSVAADNHNKLVGTVSNFELSGGESNNWEITLGASTTADISTGGSFTDGVAMVKGQADATWSATFHGAGADLDGAGSGTNLAPPPVVVGEFNGNFGNGSVAGAYGARYMKE